MVEARPWQYSDAVESTLLIDTVSLPTTAADPGWMPSEPHPLSSRPTRARPTTPTDRPDTRPAPTLALASLTMPSGELAVRAHPHGPQQHPRRRVLSLRSRCPPVSSQ